MSVVGGPIAFLYDIHGNLVAFDAVLEDTAAAGAATYVFGGDYAAMGPWPRQTVERMRVACDGATFIRGNTERWLAEGTEIDMDVVERGLEHARRELTQEQAEWLYGLPFDALLYGVHVVHGTPRRDDRTFHREPADDDEELLEGARAPVVVFGHSHVQFARRGPGDVRLVNPGSVGQPLDGDRRAAYALLRGADWELRRVEYDVERAVAQMRAAGEWAEELARRLETARADD